MQRMFIPGSNRVLGGASFCPTGTWAQGDLEVPSWLAHPRGRSTLAVLFFRWGRRPYSV